MMKSTLREWLALTAAERKVALVLVGAFILGLGIRLYWQTFPPQRTFDYSSSDSTFVALSAAEGETPGDRTPGQTGPLNINTATKSDLVKLPGIGEVTAERILAYRNDVGPFSAVEDLRKIRGISKLKLEKLRPLVTVH
jgi:competence protein ComEA